MLTPSGAFPLSIASPVTNVLIFRQIHCITWWHDCRTHFCYFNFTINFSIQQSGPSALTVNLYQLALQWIQPKPGLRLSPGCPSSYERGKSFMKNLEKALAKSTVFLRYPLFRCVLVVFRRWHCFNWTTCQILHDSAWTQYWRNVVEIKKGLCLKRRPNLLYSLLVSLLLLLSLNKNIQYKRFHWTSALYHYNIA